MPVANNIGFGPLKGPDTGMLFGSGLVLAYTENNAVVNVASGGETTTMQLLVSTLAVSNGICGFNLQGTASADLNLRVEVLHSGSVAATFLTRVKAGPAMVSGPFLLINIPAETANWQLRLRADGGTWSMPASASSWWIESGAIEGGLVASDPSSLVTEAVDETPHTVGESADYDIDVPTGATVAEAVDHDPVAIAESFLVLLENTLYPSGSLHDGFYSATTFNTGNQTTQVGNTSGEARDSFWLFTLPQDLGGADIEVAWLDVTPDSNMASPVSVVLSCEYLGDPSAVTSHADAEARIRTIAALSTSVTAVAGVKLSFNITAMVEEIAAGLPYGGFWGLQVFMDDNGSASESLLQLRSKDYVGAATNHPALRVRFKDVVAFGYYAGYAGGF